MFTRKFVGNLNLFTMGFCIGLAVVAFVDGRYSTMATHVLLAIANATMAWVNLQE